MINPANLEEIIERFYQLRKRTPGISLKITKDEAIIDIARANKLYGHKSKNL